MARVKEAAHARDRQYREVQQDFSGSPARASQEPRAELSDVQSSTERVEEREQRCAAGRRQQLRQQRTEIAFPHDPADRAVGIRSIQGPGTGRRTVEVPARRRSRSLPAAGSLAPLARTATANPRCAVVVAALPGVAVEEHHPTALNDRPGPSLRTAEGRPTKSRA